MYTTGVSDLRNLISDGPQDKYSYRKRCFGDVNGCNTAFKTFDGRRVTNFTIAGSGGVYVAGSLVQAFNVTSDDVIAGEFVLQSAPCDGAEVEASYYSQWFLDSELTSFLGIAMQWLLSSNEFINIPDGLISSLQKYAAAEAYLKLATRWRTYNSQGYKVEDAPKDSPTYNTDSFTSMAKTFRAEALAARDEYYTRQGRPLQPLFGRIRGRIRTMP